MEGKNGRSHRCHKICSLCMEGVLCSPPENKVKLVGHHLLERLPLYSNFIISLSLTFVQHFMSTAENATGTSHTPASRRICKELQVVAEILSPSLLSFPPQRSYAASNPSKHTTPTCLMRIAPINLL